MEPNSSAILISLSISFVSSEHPYIVGIANNVYFCAVSGAPQDDDDDHHHQHSNKSINQSNRLISSASPVLAHGERLPTRDSSRATHNTVILLLTHRPTTQVDVAPSGLLPKGQQPTALPLAPPTSAHSFLRTWRLLLFSYYVVGRFGSVHESWP